MSSEELTEAGRAARDAFVDENGPIANGQYNAAWNRIAAAVLQTPQVREWRRKATMLDRLAFLGKL